jgi:hypothetical protein
MTAEQEKNLRPMDDRVGAVGSQSWLERLFSIGRLWKPSNTSGQASRGKRRQFRDRLDNRRPTPAPWSADAISKARDDMRQQRRAEAFALECKEVSRDLPAEPRKARRKIARMRLKLRAAEGVKR